MEGSTDKVAEKSTKPLGMRKNGMRCPALRFIIHRWLFANIFGSTRKTMACTEEGISPD
jgi:hypothetical protein